MLTPLDAYQAIKSLSVEDDPAEKTSIARQLTRRGLFQPEVIPDFAQLKAKAFDKGIVSLDVRIENSDEKSIHAARDLVLDDPARSVYFLTNHLGAIKRKPLPGIYFLVEKNERVLTNLDSIQAGILAHHKCLFLANRISKLSQAGNDVLAKQLFKEAGGLCVGVRMLSHRLKDHEPIEAARYSQLEGKLLPLCEANPSQVVLSDIDLKALSEPLLDFAIAEQEALLKFPGVEATSYLEKTIRALVEMGEPGEPLAEFNAFSDIERRYTEVDFPPVCKLNDVVHVKIQIKCSGGKHPIDIPYEGKNEVELKIHVSGDGFIIRSNFPSLTVPRFTDSESISIPVQPRAVGEQYLFINFYREALQIGSIIVRTLVDSSEEVK